MKLHGYPVDAGDVVFNSVLGPCTASRATHDGFIMVASNGEECFMPADGKLGNVVVRSWQTPPVEHPAKAPAATVARYRDAVRALHTAFFGAPQ